MTALATAYVEIRPDTKRVKPDAEKALQGIDGTAAGKKTGAGFGKGFQPEVDKSTKKTGGSFKAMAATMGGAFVAAGAASFFKDAIEGASDLSESASKVGVVFGKQSGQILASSQTSAKAMGLSKQAYLDATGTLGNLLVSLKIAPKAAADMSQQMVKLAGDMASFNNVSPEEALAAIKSGLTGETEPLKAFGVNMNDATLQAQALKLGLIKTTKEAMTPQTKALAAQALIMEQTKTAQGDFARTSGGLANQQRILSAQFADTKAKLGQQLLPAMTKLAGFANSTLIPALSSVVDFMAANGKAVAITAGAVVGLYAAVKLVSAAQAVWGAGTVVVNAAQKLLALRAGTAAVAIEGEATASRNLSFASVGAGTAMLGLVGAAVAVGNALDHAAGGVGLFGGDLSATHWVDDFTDSLIKSKGALDQHTTDLVHTTLAHENLTAKAARTGIGEDELTTAVMGNRDALGLLINKWKEAGDPSDKTIADLGYMNQAFNEGSVAAANVAKNMPPVATSITNVGNAAGPTGVKMSDLAIASRDASLEMIKNNDAAGLLRKGLDSLSGKAIGVEESSIRLQDGLAALKTRFDEAKKNGDTFTTSLDSNSVASRANRQTIIDNIKAAQDHAVAIGAQTGSAVKAADAMRADEVGIRAAAKAAGFNVTETDKMIKKYGGVPKDIKTQMDLVDKVSIPLSAVDRHLSALDGKYVTATVSLDINAKGIPLSSVDRYLGIGGNASGTMGWRGGLTDINERGAELVDLPRGSKVYTNSQSRNMIRDEIAAAGIGNPAAAAGAQTINLVVDGRVLAQVVAEQNLISGRRN
jgi:hypothetical protein